MIEFDKDQKVLQTIPAPGWRALVSYDGEPAGEFPVVAWLSYREDDCGYPHPQRARFTAIVQDHNGDLEALTAFDAADIHVLYLGPEQERTPEHDALLAKRYAIAQRDVK